ncbi:hypothetical protein UPYG_G00139650 [Umbra pygmaea]|uniref:Uncharacterized protein n=1 Tax=Umbra pygmaea TaxID=75934 RepID=A0ABD0WV10_UMBPY
MQSVGCHLGTLTVGSGTNEDLRWKQLLDERASQPGGFVYMDALVTCLLQLSLCLVSLCQSTGQSEEFINGQVQPVPGRQHLELKDQKEAEKVVTTKQLYVYVEHSNAQLGIFMAAALGIIVLMALVYCIYSQYYTKYPYLHTQLQNHSELTLDLPEAPPLFFHSSVGAMNTADEVWRATNGSLISDTPSIISVPPKLSPPPYSLPYPPFFLSSNSLWTISARNLDRSFV